jgi:hypothetical protein
MGDGQALPHSPWLTWIFTAFGVIAAFINLFRIGLRKE